jgi:cytochrome oxidase Cu insertion factor (SCO1/SenC/PrrC family)
MRAAGKGLGLVARVIVVIASLVFLIIALGILLIVLDANPGNAVVQTVTALARFLVGPFDGLFTFRDQQLETAINWGIAGFVWLIAAGLVARLLRGIGGRGRSRRTKR